MKAPSNGYCPTANESTALRKRSMSLLQDSLMFLFVVLVPFQDTGLRQTALKGLAASPAVIPLALLALVRATDYLWRARPKVSRLGLCVGSYVVLLCSAYSFLMHLTGEQILKPLLNYGVLSLLLLFATFGIDYRRSRTVRVAVFVAFFITVAGILTDLNASSTVSILRSTPNFSGRPRGLSTESSTLSVQVVLIGMLAAHFASDTWKKWLLAATTCSLLFYSDSKGGLISLFICGIALFISGMRGRLTVKLAASVVLIPVIYVGCLVIASRFSTIIEANETSTIATRFSMTVYAISTVLHNPLGVGFTGFLPSIPKYLPGAEALVQHVFPFPLAFGEVEQYLYPPQNDADCKTFLFDFITFFGIPFAAMFVTFTFRTLGALLRQRHRWLFVGAMFAIMALSTYYSALNAYAVPLIIGVAIQETKRNEDFIRL